MNADPQVYVLVPRKQGVEALGLSNKLACQLHFDQQFSTTAVFYCNGKISNVNG